MKFEQLGKNFLILEEYSALRGTWRWGIYQVFGREFWNERRRSLITVRGFSFRLAAFRWLFRANQTDRRVVRLLSFTGLHRHFLNRRPWSRPFMPQIRWPLKRFDGREEIDNRIRATYRDLLTVGGTRARTGRWIRGWNFAWRGRYRACGNGANCWKRSCRIRLPLLMDLLRGIPESSSLRIKTYRNRSNLT